MNIEYKISIIIPVYNSEKYVSKCIESALNQTYKNVEIIAVLDETDNSNAILKKIAKKDNRLNILYKRNNGAISNRIEGLKIASGDYVTFLDSDDWIETDMIEKMLASMSSRIVDVIRCGYIREDIQKNKSEYVKIIKDELIFVEKSNIKRELYIPLLSTYLYNSMCCQIIKKDIINLDNIDFGMVLGEDLNFNLKLYDSINNILLLSECYYHYRNNNDSIMNNIAYNKQLKYIKDIQKVYMNALGYSKKWEINELIEIKKIYIYILKEISGHALKIFLIKGIKKSEYNTYFSCILKNELLTEIKKVLSIKDVNNYNSGMRGFMRIVYSCDEKKIIFCGKNIYKNIYFLKKHIKELIKF